MGDSSSAGARESTRLVSSADERQRFLSIQSWRTRLGPEEVIDEVHQHQLLELVVDERNVNLDPVVLRIAHPESVANSSCTLVRLPGPAGIEAL